MQMSTENLDGESKKPNADKLLMQFGTFGRFQLRGYVLCQFLNFFYSSSFLVVSYVQSLPNALCWSANKTESVCGRRASGVYSCPDGYALDEGFAPMTESLLVEFHLECANPFWIEGGATFFTVGAMSVVPLLSRLADVYGRRPLILVTLFLSVALNILVPLSPNFTVYLILRFFIGASSDAYLGISQILTCELISSGTRPWISLVYTIAWSLGIIWIGVLATFIKNWRWLYGIVICPGILSVFYCCYLDESPHWLITKNRHDELREYVRKANRLNKSTVSISECVEARERNPEPETSCWNILSNSTILKYILVNGYIQFALSIIYFSISFSSINFTNDHITAFIIAGAVDIPGGLAVIPLMHVMGRRTIIAICLFTQSLIICIVPYTGSGWLFVTSIMLAKMLNSIIYAVHPIYVSEMVPTTVRSLLFSIINVPQSLGMIAGPFFKHVRFGYAPTSYLVLSAMSAVAGIVTFLLPETKGENLPQDMSDLSVDTTLLECSDDD